MRPLLALLPAQRRRDQFAPHLSSSIPLGNLMMFYARRCQAQRHAGRHEAAAAPVFHRLDPWNARNDVCFGFGRLALAGARAGRDCRGARRLGAPDRCRLGVSRLARLLRPPLSACRPQFQQSHPRDDSSLFREHARGCHRRPLDVWAVWNRKNRGQPLECRGPAVRSGVRARRARRLDGHAAAEALDRHRSFAGRPDHLGDSVVAVA